MADDSSSAVSDTEEQKEVGTTIAEDIVVTKYKMASEITNRTFFFISNVFFISNLKIKKYKRSFKGIS